MYQLRPSAAAAAGLTTSAVAIVPEASESIGRRFLSFPVYLLVGTLYLAFFPKGKTPTTAEILNYGKQYTSADGYVQVMAGDQCIPWAYLSTGTFTCYPTEWNQ